MQMAISPSMQEKLDNLNLYLPAIRAAHPDLEWKLTFNNEIALEGENEMGDVLCVVTPTMCMSFRTQYAVKAHHLNNPTTTWTKVVYLDHDHASAARAGVLTAHIRSMREQADHFPAPRSDAPATPLQDVLTVGAALQRALPNLRWEVRGSGGVPRIVAYIPDDAEVAIEVYPASQFPADESIPAAPPPKGGWQVSVRVLTRRLLPICTDLPSIGAQLVHYLAPLTFSDNPTETVFAARELLEGKRYPRL
jgi:hypothetical protein